MAIDLQNQQQGGIDVELIEEGGYPARVARIIELGKQETPWGAKHQVVFGFTIPSEKVEINGETKQRMLWAFPYNLGDGEKPKVNPDSNVAKTSAAIDPKASGWHDLIGKPCTIQVEQKENKKTKGKFHNNITNVSMPMRGMEVEEPDCDVYVFDFDNPDPEVWDKLSDWRKEQIQNAVNYEGSAVEAMVEGTNVEDNPI